MASWKGVVKSLKGELKRRGPQIAIGIGTAGMVTGAVLAVKATPKALRLLEELKKEKETEELSTGDVIKCCWKEYVPAAATIILSGVCIIGGSRIEYKRNSVLAATCALSETALKEYQTAAKKIVGEKKENEIKDEVARTRIENDPIGSKEVIFTGKGETLCYDSISGRYFKSSMDAIQRTVNELNKQLLSHDYVSLNELYDGFHLAPVKMGDEMGWDIDKGLIDIRFSTMLAEDGSPCLVLDYYPAPPTWMKMW